MHVVSLEVLQTLNFWDVRDIKNATRNHQKFIFMLTDFSFAMHRHHINKLVLFWLSFHWNNFWIETNMFNNMVSLSIALKIFLNHLCCRIDRSALRPRMSHQINIIFWCICDHFFPYWSCLGVPNSTNPCTFLEHLRNKSVL